MPLINNIDTHFRLQTNFPTQHILIITKKIISHHTKEPIYIHHTCQKSNSLPFEAPKKHFFTPHCNNYPQLDKTNRNIRHTLVNLLTWRATSPRASLSSYCCRNISNSKAFKPEGRDMLFLLNDFLRSWTCSWSGVVVSRISSSPSSAKGRLCCVSLNVSLGGEFTIIIGISGGTPFWPLFFMALENTIKGIRGISM